MEGVVIRDVPANGNRDLHSHRVLCVQPHPAVPAPGAADPYRPPGEGKPGEPRPHVGPFIMAVVAGDPAARVLVCHDHRWGDVGIKAGLAGGESAGFRLRELMINSNAGKNFFSRRVILMGCYTGGREG